MQIKVPCNICGEHVMYLDKHIISKHMKKEEEKEVKCQLCEKTLPAGTIRWHVLKEHVQSKVLECSLCDQKFDNQHTLKLHIRKVHLSVNNTCNICNKECIDLEYHVNYFHHQGSKHKCLFCTKKFPTKYLLNIHAESHHLGKMTKCCDKFSENWCERSACARTVSVRG